MITWMAYARVTTIGKCHINQNGTPACIKHHLCNQHHRSLLSATDALQGTITATGASGPSLGAPSSSTPTSLLHRRRRPQTSTQAQPCIHPCGWQLCNTRLLHRCAVGSAHACCHHSHHSDAVSNHMPATATRAASGVLRMATMLFYDLHLFNPLHPPTTARAKAA